MSLEGHAKWARDMLTHLGKGHPDWFVGEGTAPCLHCGQLMCLDHPERGFYDCVGPGKHEAPWQHEINQGER